MNALRKFALAATLACTAIAAQAGSLKNSYPAPEITGIEKWINCIRTLPYVKRWHEKYKDQGLVVIGMHTPEFPYERSTENVMEALKRFDIKYPVAQDNKYATWEAYNNRYWPAAYLINKKGQVVYTHFGEGRYEETEAAIRALLAEPS
jgi:glutathione peroxidase-family protein